MKILSLFMALLVMALNCLPCADSDSLNSQANIETAAHSDIPQEEDHDDSCSPFCNCICCASISLYHLSKFEIAALTLHPIEHSSIYLYSTKEMSLPVWQPPQLS